jgi:cAMP-binding protein
VIFLNYEALQNNRLFLDMNTLEINTALYILNARYQTFEKGEIILHAGGQTDCVCLVISGSVTIENNDMWGNRTILNIVDSDDFFAETYAILKDETMMVDAVANEQCAIMFLRIGGLFGSGFEGQPWSNKLVRNLLTISANKNLILSGRSFHISPKTARGRIMAYLNSVSLKKHSKVFDIPFDRQQMADYLNLERTALSKELSRMKREKIIDFKKNHFEILP